LAMRTACKDRRHAMQRLAWLGRRRLALHRIGQPLVCVCIFASGPAAACLYTAGGASAARLPTPASKDPFIISANTDASGWLVRRANKCLCPVESSSVAVGYLLCWHCESETLVLPHRRRSSWLASRANIGKHGETPIPSRSELQKPHTPRLDQLLHVAAGKFGTFGVLASSHTRQRAQRLGPIPGKRSLHTWCLSRLTPIYRSK
jgi:hypothetical protein